MKRGVVPSTMSPIYKATVATRCSPDETTVESKLVLQTKRSSAPLLQHKARTSSTTEAILRINTIDLERTNKQLGDDLRSTLNHHENQSPDDQPKTDAANGSDEALPIVWSSTIAMVGKQRKRTNERRKEDKTGRRIREIRRFTVCPSPGSSVGHRFFVSPWWRLATRSKLILSTH